MTLSRISPAGDRIIEPMVTLAGCSKQHRIVVAGARGVELMLELQRRGYVRAAATANCGHPTGQYDIAKPFGSRWNGAASSLRGEPSMTAAAPFRRGAEK
jgi:hypothetical protein